MLDTFQGYEGFLSRGYMISKSKWQIVGELGQEYEINPPCRNRGVTSFPAIRRFAKPIHRAGAGPSRLTHYKDIK